jgi:SAM-dependent methyltransferase
MTNFQHQTWIGKNMNKFNIDELVKISENLENEFYIENDKFQEQSYTLLHKKRLEELFYLINTKISNAHKILDVGTTPFTFYLKKHTSCEVYSLDFTDGFKNRCTKANIIFKQFDLRGEGIPFEENLFDLIVFTEVFEHILSDPISLLQKFHKMLKPGGLLILSTPNQASLSYRLKLLFNRPILEYPTWQLSSNSIHGHGHNRLFVTRELTDYMKKAGFDKIKVSYSSKSDFIYSTHYSEPKNVLFKKIIKNTFFRPLLFLFPSFRGAIYLQAEK